MLEAPEQRIVSDELWGRVERQRENTKRLYGRHGGRAASSAYLSSGILKCGLCGASMNIVSGAGKRDRYASYGCPLNAFRGATLCKNSLRI